METSTSNATETSLNKKERKGFEFEFAPQSEVWNERLAMLGFVAYLNWI